MGSETIDDESYLTQRHELSVFTQRTGQITIPPFPVRFSGKKSFTAQPEPVTAQTKALTFQSKRPDVPAELGIVIAAAKLNVTESWNPDSITELTIGDVVERVIRREASNTTAMMMPEIDASSPSGVRIHRAAPVVRDRSNRGSVTAEREDTIKYQFEQPGAVTVPAITISWWDTDSAALEQQVLPERVFRVEGEVAADESLNSESTTSNAIWMLGAVGLLFIAVVPLVLYRWIKPSALGEERMAAAKVRTACRSNDAMLAYESWLQWRRTLEGDRGVAVLQSDPFYEQLSSLRQHLFGNPKTSTAWSGHQFLNVFETFRQRILRTDSSKIEPPDLPALNPR